MSVTLSVFLGPRLHLVCALRGLLVVWAQTGAKADEREVLEAVFASTPTPARPGRQFVIADKAYCGRAFEAGLGPQYYLMTRCEEGFLGT